MTPTQIAKVRRALGIYSARFTDEQLGEFYADAYEENPLTWFAGTVSEAFYTLAMAAVEMTDFKQGETSESQSKIYDRLWALYQRWANEAGYLSLPVFGLTQVRLRYVDMPEDCDA